MPGADHTTGEEHEPTRPARVLRRRRALWLLGGGAVAVTAGGLVAARFVRSPAQQLADAAPPPRTTLTAAVEHRVLSDTVVLRGQVGAGTTVEVTPTPAEAQRSVVTAVRVEPGEEFDAGAVLLEVSGRPLFALTGEIPAYRDLLPGMRGTDVTQLQEALADLGHLQGEPDGELGPATKTALAEFYADRGYQAPTTGEPGVLAEAEEAVRRAERAVVEAQDALDLARADPPAPVPGEPDPVARAGRQVEFAQEDLAAAQERRDEVARTTGAMLPLSEVVYLPAFPARVERMTAEMGLDLTAGELPEPLLTVSSGDLVVRARLNPAQRELLAVGMPVEILAELEDVSATGEIAQIGELSADPASGARGHDLTVTATDGPFDDRLAGADVRLTVAAATTEDEVLVVPVSAVFAGADGEVAVLRLGLEGQRERIVVTTGVTGDGYVEVTPADGDLTEGDQVVVGADGAEP